MQKINFSTAEFEGYVKIKKFLNFIYYKVGSQLLEARLSEKENGTILHVSVSGYIVAVSVESISSSMCSSLIQFNCTASFKYLVWFKQIISMCQHMLERYLHGLKLKKAPDKFVVRAQTSSCRFQSFQIASFSYAWLPITCSIITHLYLGFNCVD